MKTSPFPNSRLLMPCVLSNALEFIRLGFRAYVVCVDSTQMEPALVGSRFDEKFMQLQGRRSA